MQFDWHYQCRVGRDIALAGSSRAPTGDGSRVPYSYPTQDTGRQPNFVAYLLVI
jgi:hypothetical protein